DPARWGTGCAVYGAVRMQGLYPGIDLRIDGSAGLKYDFIVAAGADVSRIRMRFDGHDGLQLVEGRLLVKTTAGTVAEEAPVAWQDGPGGRRNVRCRFALAGSEVHFILPDGY